MKMKNKAAPSAGTLGAVQAKTKRIKYCLSSVLLYHILRAFATRKEKFYEYKS